MTYGKIDSNNPRDTGDKLGTYYPRRMLRLLTGNRHVGTGLNSRAALLLANIDGTRPPKDIFDNLNLKSGVDDFVNNSNLRNVETLSGDLQVETTKLSDIFKNNPAVADAFKLALQNNNSQTMVNEFNNSYAVMEDYLDKNATLVRPGPALLKRYDTTKSNLGRDCQNEHDEILKSLDALKTDTDFVAAVKNAMPAGTTDDQAQTEAARLVDELKSNFTAKEAEARKTMLDKIQAGRDELSKNIAILMQRAEHRAFFIGTDMQQYLPHSLAEAFNDFNTSKQPVALGSTKPSLRDADIDTIVNALANNAPAGHQIRDSLMNHGVYFNTDHSIKITQPGDEGAWIIGLHLYFATNERNGAPRDEKLALTVDTKSDARAAIMAALAVGVKIENISIKLKGNEIKSDKMMEQIFTESGNATGNERESVSYSKRLQDALNDAAQRKQRLETVKSTELTGKVQQIP